MSAITHAHACSQTHGLTIIYHQFQSMSAIGTSMAACFSDLISAWSPLLPYARLLASSETSNCGALRLEAGRPILRVLRFHKIRWLRSEWDEAPGRNSHTPPASWVAPSPFNNCMIGIRSIICIPLRTGSLMKSNGSQLPLLASEATRQMRGRVTGSFFHVLHSSLCIAQSTTCSANTPWSKATGFYFFWHPLEQYHTFLHAEHLRSWASAGVSSQR